jgi:hypothetical protein
MRLTRLAKVGAASLALAVGGAVAAFNPISPAVAFFSPPLFLDIRVDSPATLVARGAAVDVPVEITCTSAEAFVDVSVTQRAGSDVARGFGSARVGCTGQRERILVTVTASDGKAFRKQTAVADANIFGCAETFCGNERDTATIEIRR